MRRKVDGHGDEGAHPVEHIPFEDIPGLLIALGIHFKDTNGSVRGCSGEALPIVIHLGIMLCGR